MNEQLPCPECSEMMDYTGLPDLAGPVKFRFFRCPNHGLIKVFEDESNTKEQSQRLTPTPSKRNEK